MKTLKPKPRAEWKKQFRKKMREAFLGQFPNEICMNKPDISYMKTNVYKINDELLEWLDVTLDKFEELVLNPLLSRREQEVREEIVEEIEKVFDQCRSSNVKDKKGERMFGIPLKMKLDARQLHNDIFQAIEAVKK